MKIGVSSCLLGCACRYNGQDSRDGYIINTLGKYFEFVGYCPEEPVLGTPREPIRLVDVDGETRVMTNVTKVDVTNDLQNVCNDFVEDIKNQQLCGFIFKSKSPSCGMERVKLYKPDSYLCEKKGVGVFAKSIMDAFPLLPMEEEGRLEDPWLRENFLMAVFAYSQLQDFSKNAKSIKDIVEFHTSFKYLIYSKSTKYYKELGHIVANSEKMKFEDILENYAVKFKEAINQKGSIPKTYNILLHIYGYFKNDVTKEEKHEILNSMEEFKQGLIPLIVIIKILELYIKRFNIEYLLKQKFFNPYPKELALRSDVEAFKP